MGIIDMFLINNDNIRKGFVALTKGSKFIVAYNKEGDMMAYTIGIDVGRQIMDKYFEDMGIDKASIEFIEEFHKVKDGFTSINQNCQICIVDKELMLKKNVIELMKSEELIPYKNNKKMVGLDKYTRK